MCPRCFLMLPGVYASSCSGRKARPLQPELNFPDAGSGIPRSGAVGAPRPSREGKVHHVPTGLIQLSKNGQKPDEAVLKLCSISLFHPLYGPKIYFRDIGRYLGVKPRFPAWIKGIMPFDGPLIGLNWTKVDGFSIFSAEGDDPRTGATSPQGRRSVYPFAGRTGGWVRKTIMITLCACSIGLSK
jgi:hypothetical protein